VDPVADPLLLRKPGSAGKWTPDLIIWSQEIAALPIHVFVHKEAEIAQWVQRQTTSSTAQIRFPKGARTFCIHSRYGRNQLRIWRAFLQTALSDQLLCRQHQLPWSVSLQSVISTWRRPQAPHISGVRLSPLTVKQRMCVGSLEGQKRLLTRCQSLPLRGLGIGVVFTWSVYYSRKTCVPLR
jgi:hypothetical protein